MLKMLHRLIGENIDLVWLPGYGLWPVKMDTSQIDQILVNLCINARDAIKNNGRITVETGNSTIDKNYCSGQAGIVPGEYVKITVSDNGCGIKKETKVHIFEPFFTTKGIGEGTGLGLATVYGIVQQNNGFINVYSEPGYGTTFSIFLPRYMGAAKQGQVGITAESDLRGDETILLVEDESTLLDMTMTMLQRLGYKVLAAKNPGEALRLADEFSSKIHILLTDVIMPDMNGRDLAQSLLSLHPHLKCLFMSGYTSDIIAQQGILDEGVQFIQKPFSKSDLATKIRMVLRQEV
jgi:CheY-like chemotaxis protein